MDRMLLLTVGAIMYVACVKQRCLLTLPTSHFAYYHFAYCCVQVSLSLHILCHFDYLPNYQIPPCTYPETLYLQYRTCTFETLLTYRQTSNP